MSDAAEKEQQKHQQPPEKKVKLNEEIDETIDLLAKSADEKEIDSQEDEESSESSESSSTDYSFESGSGGSSEIDEGPKCSTCMKSFTKVRDSLYSEELCTKCAPKCRSCKDLDMYIFHGSKYCKSCTEDRKGPRMCRECGGKVYSDWDSDDSSDDGGVLCEYCEEELNEEKKNNGK